MYSERVDNDGNIVPFGDDFNLLPGEGYFVKSLVSSNFILAGKKVDGALPIMVDAGWNLVGIYNSNKDSFTGFEVLRQAKEQGVEAKVISKWESGNYMNLVNANGMEYGIDYKVFPEKGYWIQNEGAKGKYTPQ